MKSMFDILESRPLLAVRRVLPAPVRRTLRPAYQAVLGAGDFAWRHATGRAHWPPLRLQELIGRGDYDAIGKEFLGHFQALGDLRPDDRVLEIGCGAGRMAWPLARYLSTQGRYVGTEICADAVRWCQRTIGARYPNFSFLHTDLFSKLYNPRATQRASEYRFPFPERSFDFVALVSVFTHMLPAGLERYVEEVARLLDPHGRALLTFFLLNDEQRRLTEQGRSALAFSHTCDDYAVANPDFPEAAVGYGEDTVRELLSRKGLRLREPIHYGSWAGRTRKRCVSYQDIVIVTPL